MAEGEAFLSLVDPGSFLDLVKGRVEDLTSHGHMVVIIEVEASVKGLVELTAGVLGRTAVKSGGVAYQV